MIKLDYKPLTGVTKTCTRCKTLRDTSLFNFHPMKKDKLDSWCRICKKSLAKVYYYKNLEKQRAKAKEYGILNKDKILKRKLTNPENYLFICAKSRAKKQGIVFSIKPEDIVIPEYCPVLGQKLEFSQGVATDNSPTIDKLIPELGYTKDNIIVISKRANRLKGDANISEIELLYKWLEKTLRERYA